MGGALQAIEQGYFQRELGNEQYRRQREMEEGKRKLVGVNHLVVPEPKRELEIWRLDDEMETQQVQKLQALRARRDNVAVRAALEKCAKPRARAPTWSSPALRRSGSTPPTVNSAMRCARCSACIIPTARRRECEHGAGSHPRAAGQARSRYPYRRRHRDRARCATPAWK